MSQNKKTNNTTEDVIHFIPSINKSLTMERSLLWFLSFSSTLSNKRKMNTCYVKLTYHKMSINLNNISVHVRSWCKMLTHFLFLTSLSGKIWNVLFSLFHWKHVITSMLSHYANYTECKMVHSVKSGMKNMPMIQKCVHVSLNMQTHPQHLI